MEYGQQNSTSLGISVLNQRLKRVWIFFAIFQSLSLAVILGSIEFATYRNKKSLAMGLTDAISNPLLVKDYRRLAELLSTSSKNEFTGVFLKDYSSNKDITLKNDRHQSRFPHKNIVVPVFFDLEEQTKIGEVTFSYKMFSLILEVLFAWLFLLIISSAWLYRFRKSMIKSYEKEIELDLTRQMGDLAKRVAHDIRSPISALNMLVNTSHGIPEEQKDIIRLVVSRVTGIAEDLLSQNNKKEIPAESDLGKANKTRHLLKATSLINSLVAEKNIEFQNHPRAQFIPRINHMPDNVEVPLSEKVILRILSNLINNSVEAIDDDGSIFIEVQLRNNVVIFSVVDFGKGIPPEVLEDLRKEDFKSYGKNKHEKSGHGIGLKSASEGLRKIGGKLQIESKVGVGTRVSIEIPTSHPH